MTALAVLVAFVLAWEYLLWQATDNVYTIVGWLGDLVALIRRRAHRLKRRLWQSLWPDCPELLALA